MPVRRLWGFYRNGASVETLLKRYPKLGPARVFDALAFALDNPEVIEADMAREEALMAQQAPRQRSPAEQRQIELPFSRADSPQSGVQAEAGVAPIPDAGTRRR